MSRTTRTFGKEFKAKVVKVLKELNTIVVLAKKKSCFPTKLNFGRRRHKKSFCGFFCRKNGRCQRYNSNRETLCSNRSTDFGEWLSKKKSGLVPLSERVKMVDTQNKLSIVKQCQLIETHRSGIINITR